MADPQDNRMPGQWIDTDAGFARAEQVNREARLLARVLAAGEEYWAEIERRNSFRDRWAKATGRQR